jgi:hypothetical protein
VRLVSPRAAAQKRTATAVQGETTTVTQRAGLAAAAAASKDKRPMPAVDSTLVGFEIDYRT